MKLKIKLKLKKNKEKILFFRLILLCEEVFSEYPSFQEDAFMMLFRNDGFA